MSALVLLPGLGGTGKMFYPLEDAMPDADILIASYPTDVAASYAELETRVRAMLPDRPFVLLGESFSGPLAISIAADPPPMMRALILCASFASNPRPVFTALSGIARRAPRRALPMIVLDPILRGRHSTRETRAELERILSGVKSDVLSERLAAVLRIDVTDKLARVRLPVVYLQARHDYVIPASAWRRIARHCPHAQRVEFDAPHFLLQTVPHEAARTIREVMAQADVAHGSASA